MNRQREAMPPLRTSLQSMAAGSSMRSGDIFARAALRATRVQSDCIHNQCILYNHLPERLAALSITGLGSGRHEVS